MISRSNIKYDIVAVAQGIVDILAYGNQEFLEKHALIKGSMELISSDRALYLSESIRYIKVTSGGSAANTMAGLASFGAKAAIIAKVNDDEFGTIFKRDLGMCGVDFLGVTSKAGDITGRCFVVVSKEDAERTMSTYLGVASEMGAEDINNNAIKNSSILYIEAYLLDSLPGRSALARSIAEAKKYNRMIALTLSDVRCAQQHRDRIFAIMKDIDLIFANENEIKTLFQTNDLETALEKVGQAVKIATITRGGNGSVTISGNDKWVVEAAHNPAKIVDTTGAGDLYASGFLFAMIKQLDLKDSARLANLAAAECISHLGARPEITLSSLLNKL